MKNKFNKSAVFNSGYYLSDYDSFNCKSINSIVSVDKNNFTKVRNLNYKFKRKSKNFFCWLKNVKNIHYSVSDGLIVG
jgi:S-adenosylmethionine:diacylglycerol 3-amino-3-carboxypropyl transferase